MINSECYLRWQNSFNIVSADFHKKEIDIDVLFQRAKKRKLEDLGSDDESG
jgi:hypothetical protein